MSPIAHYYCKLQIHELRQVLVKDSTRDLQLFKILGKVTKKVKHKPNKRPNVEFTYSSKKWYAITKD